MPPLWRSLWLFGCAWAAGALFFAPSSGSQLWGQIARDPNSSARERAAASHFFDAANRSQNRGGWTFLSSDAVMLPGSWQTRGENVTDDSLLHATSSWCERIDFKCGHGTEVLVAYPVEPTLIIPELEVHLRARCEQSHLQLIAQVTFPNTPSPSGTGPLKTLIRGPKISAANQWHDLTFGSSATPLTVDLNEQVWILRRKYGIPIDTQNAFIDKVVVNMYSEPGAHRAWLGSPEMTGAVTAQPKIVAQSPIRDVHLRQVGFELEDDRPPARSRRAGSVIEVDERPFFARMIQHNGEAFEYLKGLGFNTIQLGTTATSEQLRTALELELWIVCPPPPSTGLKPMGNFYDPVLAWSLGENLQQQNVTATQRLSREIRANDPRKDRPLWVNMNSSWAEFGQVADILTVGFRPFGANFPLSQYDNWIGGVAKSMTGNLPLWSEIQTEHSRSVVQQAGLMTGRLPPLPLSREQLESMAFQAISGGARGLRFLSRSRLDSADPQTRLRAQTLTWLNHRLTLLEPWIMGGVVMGQLPNEDPNLQVTAIKTNRAQLLLIQQQTQTEQYVAGDAEIRTIRFQDNYSAIADQAYWLTDYGLLPLGQDRTAAGATIQIDACPSNAAVVLTQDPGVIQRLNMLYRRQEADSPLLLRSNLTRQWLAFTQLVESDCSRMGRSSPIASGNYNEALNAFQKADALIRSGSAIAAAPLLDIADQKLASTRRELLSLARDQFAAPISDPLFYHISLLPLHWTLSARMRNATWGPNALPGYDFEDINHMIKNGWRYTTYRDPKLQTEVALTPQAAIAGKTGLSLTASMSLSPEALVQASPLIIESAPVRVQAAQLILIHGWAKIDAPLTGTFDGLMVYDSIGGREMAYRVNHAAGWQEFKLYRAAGESADLRITFELTGCGSVAIDEVTVRTVDLNLDVGSPPTMPDSPAATTGQYPAESIKK